MTLTPQEQPGYAPTVHGPRCGPLPETIKVEDVMRGAQLRQEVDGFVEELMDLVEERVSVFSARLVDAGVGMVELEEAMGTITEELREFTESDLVQAALDGAEEEGDEEDDDE